MLNKEYLDNKIKKLVARYKLSGKDVITIESYCKHKCYLINNDNESILCIPSDVKVLNNCSYKTKEGSNSFIEALPVTRHLIGKVKNLKVIGGIGLIDTYCMFKACGHLKSLDISEFSTQNVRNMKEMFSSINMKKLDISQLDTSKCVNMSYMFGISNINELNLGSIDTSNVLNMEGMFYSANIDKLSMNLDTHNVLNMDRTFEMFKGKDIDLPLFDTRNVTSMHGMFRYCKCKSIRLSEFNFNKVNDLTSIIEECEADNLDKFIRLFNFGGSN